MKSMQRKFGGLLKRSADDQDVGSVLAEHNAVNDMLDRLLKDLKLWREQWEDILKYQYDCCSAFADLYKHIEPAGGVPPDAPAERRHQPTQTPQKYLQKCLALQKTYQDAMDDLAQEIGMITTKLIQPAEHAKLHLKPLKRTLQHRENTKLDYERYLGRAEHARKKETRSQKEEVALAAHENHLTQAKIDYETADEQVRTTLPPVNAAVKSMLPMLLASQVMLQTTLVGQLYTVVDGYCRKFNLPSPAPSDQEIISTWDSEFSGLRHELEEGLKVVRTGKAINQSMALPAEKPAGSVTGLGIRGRIIPGRSTSQQSIPQRPTISSNHSQPQLQLPPGGHSSNNNDEDAPPQPPRPGGRPPQIDLGSKPRIPSGASTPGRITPGGMTPGLAALPYPNHDPVSQGGTPPSRYRTPVNGGMTPQPSNPLSPAASSLYTLSPQTSHASNAGGDYFAQRRASQASMQSLASSAASIAAKKKPPPPVPTKRFPSQQTTFVTAMYDFEGQNAGDLAFREGDRIKIVKKTDSQDDWWDGELRGVVGTFPANYVKV